LNATQLDLELHTVATISSHAFRNTDLQQPQIYFRSANIAQLHIDKGINLLSCVTA